MCQTQQQQPHVIPAKSYEPVTLVTTASTVVTTATPTQTTTPGKNILFATSTF